MVRWFRTLALVGLLACGPAPARAQVQTGSILVKASDPQQAVLPGANVTCAGPLLVVPMNGVTDAAGVYRFPSLPSGTYTITVEISGFQTVVRSDVVVSVGQTTTLDLKMEVGALSETVTVSGTSPVVDTTNANVNVTMSQHILQATPTGHDIWSMLEAKMPGLVVSRPDVGGAQGGSQATFSARGTTSQQNTYYINGINVGSPTSIGNTSFYFDYDSFEEIQVSTGALDMSVSTPGIFLNMVTKSGGDRYNGNGSIFWEGQQLQAANVDSNLANFGFQPKAGAVDSVSDLNGQVGGPIVRNKVRFFTSYRDWRLNNIVPGFPEVDETISKSILGNATYQIDGRNRLTAFGANQWFKRPNYPGGSPTLTPQSTQIEDNKFQLYQGLWNSVLSDTSFLDARLSYQELYFPLLQKGGSQQSLSDLSTGNLLLNAANTTISDRKRLQTSINFQKYVPQALGGRHEFRVGLDNQHSPVTTTVSTSGDVNLAYRSVPTPTASTVTVLNTPLTSQQAMNVFALFAQDAYTYKRLTVTGGVRWERLHGYLPAQSSPPSQYFPDSARSFTNTDVLSLTRAAPRLNLVYDLTGTGKTALKFAVGRYLYQISTDTVNMVNPNFVSSATYSWNDLNRDLQFTPNELGSLLSRSGGLITSFDPGIRRPFTDEVLVGIDHELLPGLKLSSVYTYRRERDLIGNTNVGVPFDTYQLVTRPDLGPDGLAGTADDTTIDVWNQNPATRGQDRFLITNSPALNQHYNGFEITANKRFSHGWQMVTGFTHSSSIANATAVTNPNTLINSLGPTTLDRPNTFKVTGTYTFPHDIAVSGNFHVQTGLAVARTATYALTQGNVTVNATPPGTDRLDPLSNTDARVAKTFKIGSHALEAIVDAFNLFNANTVWNVRTLTGRINVNAGGVPTGQVINQQQYLSPLSILSPRIVRLGAVYRF